MELGSAFARNMLIRRLSENMDKNLIMCKLPSTKIHFVGEGHFR